VDSQSTVDDAPGLLSPNGSAATWAAAYAIRDVIGWLGRPHTTASPGVWSSSEPSGCGNLTPLLTG